MSQPPLRSDARRILDQIDHMLDNNRIFLQRTPPPGPEHEWLQGAKFALEEVRTYVKEIIGP